jgi:sigma-B regulation protein RsbU (phosphoserine phosphatase)
VDRIRRATDRAGRLIADLLDFTKARLGDGLPVEPTSFDLHEMVAEYVEDLRLAHPAAVLVHERAGEGACSADLNRLSQLVGNLVSNAVAYGESQAPITVASRVDTTSFAVAVHNHGVPIPPDVQSVLFEPMTRGVNANSKARSVGLGLFIVREIAKAHRGEVLVRSEAGTGTTFTAVFPRG